MRTFLQSRRMRSFLRVVPAFALALLLTACSGGSSGSSSSSGSIITVSGSDTVSSSSVADILTSITLSQMADRPSAQPGDTVAFSLTIANATATAASNLDVTVTYPQAMVDSAKGRGAVSASGTLVWHIDTLGPLQSKTLEYTIGIKPVLTTRKALRIDILVKSSSLATPAAAITRMPLTRAANTSASIGTAPSVVTPSSSVDLRTPAVPSFSASSRRAVMPKAGADTDFYAPIEPAGKYVTPYKGMYNVQ